jgi:hypothetical protein
LRICDPEEEDCDDDDDDGLINAPAGDNFQLHETCKRNVSLYLGLLK